jgi:hypothetical protein
MDAPILLIASEAAALPVAEALRRDLDKQIEVAPNRLSGLSSLRREEYSLVLFDEGLAAADPDSADLMYQAAGAAPVLEINFAISTASRVVRQTRSALLRRAQDEAQARVAATASLQNELSASLTGLLLESQLALRDASPEQAPKLQHLVELAGGLRNLLRA